VIVLLVLVMPVMEVLVAVLHDLNGFHYHDNWWQNLLIASLLGRRSCHSVCLL